jgi:hypothetical protein
MAFNLVGKVEPDLLYSVGKRGSERGQPLLNLSPTV